MEIYWPLAKQYPAAFRQYLLIALRNYAKVAPEDDSDPWLQLLKEIQAKKPPDQGEAGAATGKD